MELKQSTLDEIADSEHVLIKDASRAHGDFFDTAHALTSLLSTQIKSIDRPEKFIFVAFHGQVKKHLILALLSTVRRHHAQASMDMRQVLEAGAWAAYAMAHDDTSRFCDVGANGLVTVPKRLEKARNKWLSENYPARSAEIQRLKAHINESSAHASVIHAMTAFKMRDADNPGFDTPIFDPEHRSQMLSDLWFVGNTAQGLVDLFHAVNEREKVFREADDFAAQFLACVAKSNQQRADMMESPEYKRAKGADV